MSSSSYKLGFNTHGKGRVRLVKVKRNKDGTHEIMQLSVQVLLEGELL
jgi:urate oxidase